MMSYFLIDSIETQRGDEIIYALRINKWKLVSQYNLLAFDKGIDFDFYCFKKENEELYFEWDNWFEWKIIGSEKILSQLTNDYSLRKSISLKNG